MIFVLNATFCLFRDSIVLKYSWSIAKMPYE